MGKCSKIRHIVRLRQMLKRWRRRAAVAAASLGPPADVPSGHVAVCVGTAPRRYVIRAAYLNHPLFGKLLAQSEEEFGYSAAGPLALPYCDEQVFEEILKQILSSSSSGKSCSGNAGARWQTESLPLLRTLADKPSVW